MTFSYADTQEIIEGSLFISWFNTVNLAEMNAMIVVFVFHL
jgi:hypothetical protein